ncbi:MAG: hypothetical protein IIU14_07795 [Ruminococcus sp.]|nr:hypothetical protein [Ruminococcus sp.]
MKNRESISQAFKSAGFPDTLAYSVLTEIAKDRAREKSFLLKAEEDWGAAFEYSECFYVIITRAVSTYSKYVSSLPEDERGEKQQSYTALRTLLDRASQQYLEILTLVKNGFSDGAFARWRSMYELSAISSFILKYGEPVAEKFIEASDSEDRYDWAMASGIFPETKRHVTFGDILRLCDIDAEVWKENYTVANQTVHASPQGTFGRLGEQDGKEIPSQRSEFGLSAPAIHSANTLALVASMLFSLYPEEETMEGLKLAAGWLDELIDIYTKTHEKLFGTEN